MEAYHSTLTHSQELKIKCRQKPEAQSINKLYPSQDGSQCNYCHKGKSYSWGLTSENYQSYTYQTMMQRGWRRCGTYYYKMNLQKSCCKQWTHRMDINQFKIKKDQKKTIKRMMALAYQPIVESISEMKAQNKPKATNYNQKSIQNKDNPKKFIKQLQPQLVNKQKSSTKLITQLSHSTQQLILQICTKLNDLICSKLQQLIPKQKVNSLNTQKWNFQFLDKLKSFNSKPQQKSDYFCNWGMLVFGCNKDKFLNIKQFNLIQFVKCIKTFVQQSKLSEDWTLTLERGGYLLIELSKKLKEQKNQDFQVIKQVKKHRKDSKDNQNHQDQKMEIQHEEKRVSIKVPQKSQKTQKMQVQPKQIDPLKKKESSCKFQKLQPQLKGELIITSDKITFGKLSILLVQAQQNNQSYKMYLRYCKEIHQKQQKGFSSYTNFLCQKALTFDKMQKQATGNKQYLPTFDPAAIHQKKRQVTGKITKRLGCYHMKYYLDDKFIAVGVIDLLPNGLSSVYFFYEPEYKDRRLGVFSSIIEIQYIRYLSLTFPEYKYYYMGFYIANNQKMSYKGDYGPFQLLCPITYNFVTVDDRLKQIVNKISQQGYQKIRLAPEGMMKDPDMAFTSDLGVYIDKNIKLSYRKKPLKLKQINPQFYIPILQLLKMYLEVWGKQIFEIFTFTF